MPSKTEKQARFFAAAAHDPAFAKRVGVSQDVAKEFNEADTGSKMLSNAMKGRDGGGGVDLSYTPPLKTNEWGRKYGVGNLGNRIEQQEEANPSVEGTVGKGEDGLRMTYRKNIGFASGGVSTVGMSTDLPASDLQDDPSAVQQEEDLRKSYLKATGQYGWVPSSEGEGIVRGPAKTITDTPQDSTWNRPFLTQDRNARMPDGVNAGTRDYNERAPTYDSRGQRPKYYPDNPDPNTISLELATGGAATLGSTMADKAYTLSRKMANEQEKAALPHFDSGGMPEAPYFERAAVRELAYANDQPIKGFLNSAGPGRTDTHPGSVGSGSYVLPADVISGYGQGNSAFGANVIQKMLSVGPYGVPLPRGGSHGGVGIPRPPAPYNPRQDIQSVYPEHFDAGGVARHDDEGDEGQPVPVALAGGEFVIPHNYWHDGQTVYKGVKQIGGGDLKRGHAILDRFVMDARKKSVAETKALPPPKKSHEK